MVKAYMKSLVFPNCNADSMCLSKNRPATTMIYAAEDYVSALLWGIRKDDYILNTFSAWLNQPVLRGSYPFLKDDTLTELHENDTCELMYIVQGSLTKNIGGKEYTFHEDDVVLLKQGILNYDHLKNEDLCVLFIRMSSRLFQQICQSKSLSPYQNYINDLLTQPGSSCSHIQGSPKCQATGASKVLQTLQAILQELIDPAPGASYIIRGLFIRLFHYLAMEYHFFVSEYSKAEMRKLLYQDVLEDIRLNCRDITIEMLQQKYFFNRDYFNRLIKKYSGFTFRELRQNIRLEEAQRLLIETDSRVEEIAQAVGYKNIGFFYKLFLEKFGKTPREYRLSER